MGQYYIGGLPYNQRQLSIVAVTSILIVLSTTAVALRVYARYLTGRRLYPDDIWIIVALVSELSSLILLF
jgi:hypothetical protein